MSTYGKDTFMLTDEKRQAVSEMSGKVMLWMLEGRSKAYMAEQLKLHPQELDDNLDRMLYVLRRQVGLKRFLKTLFR